jgi:PBSX family phage terminase large subunit
MSASTSIESAESSDLRAENRPYEPQGAALELLYSHSDEIILSGPAGTGKSRANLEKLHLVAELYPDSRQLIVRKTRESLTESALVTFEEKVVPAGHPILESPVQRRNRQSYQYPNGSVIVVGGLDKPSKVMSTEYDTIYVQEAIELSESDFESLTTRNRNFVVPWQQVIGDTNPDHPRHWLKRRADRGQLRLLESRHEDNPVLWDRRLQCWTPKGVVYIAKLNALTGARLLRLRHGRWVAAEGAVYEEFDRQLHLIDRFEIPAEWARIRVIDFGFSNPFVCQWWAIDGDGRMYLYREIYRCQRTVRVHAEQINELSAEESFDATVADHDAEDRATLEESGITTIAATKPISPGIQAVKERLKKAGDGKPRLFLFRDALVERDELLDESKRPCSTAEEFDCYMRKPGVPGKSDDENPVKANDHGMDCMRYGVAFVDQMNTHWIEVY